MEASFSHSELRACALAFQQSFPQLGVSMQLKLGAQEDDSAFKSRVSKRQRESA
jgi:hypothetical protein